MLFRPQFVLKKKLRRASRALQVTPSENFSLFYPVELTLQNGRTCYPKQSYDLLLLLLLFFNLTVVLRENDVTVLKGNFHPPFMAGTKKKMIPKELSEVR